MCFMLGVTGAWLCAVNGTFRRCACSLTAIMPSKSQHFIIFCRVFIALVKSVRSFNHSLSLFAKFFFCSVYRHHHRNGKSMCFGPASSIFLRLGSFNYDLRFGWISILWYESIKNISRWYAGNDKLQSLFICRWCVILCFVLHNSYVYIKMCPFTCIDNVLPFLLTGKKEWKHGSFVVWMWFSFWPWQYQRL